jgi:predicted nucleic acid-binding protein
MSDKATFVDSNVWLYAFIKSDLRKHPVAKAAIRQHGSLVVSAQVVSEVCVNMLKKAGRKEPFIRELISSFTRNMRLLISPEPYFSRPVAFGNAILCRIGTPSYAVRHCNRTAPHY